MIKLHISFLSDALGRDAQLTVLLPNEAAKPSRVRYPVLYLLHGLGDSADTWLNRTSLERYGDDHKMAIVLPNGARSFYCDMAYGDAYYTHISQEVSAFCEALFPVSKDPEYRYIAGNSMGAYGACKIALKNPGKYAKVGLFSGVLDIQTLVSNATQHNRDWQLCFGGTQVPEEEDLLKLLSGTKDLPKFYHYCGTGDFLVEGNRTFCALCKKLQIAMPSHWEEGGIHDWLYWDRELPRFLNWLESE